jgi:hypothetical protein
MAVRAAQNTERVVQICQAPAAIRGEEIGQRAARIIDAETLQHDRSDVAGLP